MNRDAACTLEVDVVGWHLDVGHVQGLVDAALALVGLPEQVTGGFSVADFSAVDRQKKIGLIAATKGEAGAVDGESCDGLGVFGHSAVAGWYAFMEYIHYRFNSLLVNKYAGYWHILEV